MLGIQTLGCCQNASKIGVGHHTPAQGAKTPGCLSVVCALSDLTTSPSSLVTPVWYNPCTLSSQPRGIQATAMLSAVDSDWQAMQEAL